MVLEGQPSGRVEHCRYLLKSLWETRGFSYIISECQLKKYLDIFKDHPYIFNLRHGILPDTDPGMMDYLVKTVKDY